MIVLEMGLCPEHPVSMNAAHRMHWAQRRRLTDPWKLLAFTTATNARLADALAATPCLVTVHIPVPDKRRRDPHNYMPVVKAVVDGLVRARCWPDDDPRYVTVTEPVLVYDPKGRTPASVHLTPREG